MADDQSSPTVQEQNPALDGGIGVVEISEAAIEENGIELPHIRWKFIVIAPEMCAGMVLGTIYQPRLIAVRTPDGTWQVAP